MRRRIGVTAIALVSVLILTTITAWALITPTKVLALKGYQFFPYSNGTYLAYTSNSTSQPNHFNAFARRFSDGKTVRINAIGTEGFEGGFDPGTDTVIYQQIKNAISDIYTYNLDTRVRQKLGVLDTKQWEWDPRISSTYITFFRNHVSKGKTYARLIVYTRASGTWDLLKSYPVNSVTNGSVGDTYLTWMAACGGASCNVFVRNETTRTTKQIANPNKVPQYAPAVDETNGLVFFARSGLHCGKAVKILEVPVTTLGASPTEVAALPTGFDLDTVASLSLNTNTNTYDYLFARAKCSANFVTDIYALEGVSPGP